MTEFVVSSDMSFEEISTVDSQLHRLSPESLAADDVQTKRTHFISIILADPDMRIL